MLQVSALGTEGLALKKEHVITMSSAHDNVFETTAKSKASRSHLVYIVAGLEL